MLSTGWSTTNPTPLFFPITGSAFLRFHPLPSPLFLITLSYYSFRVPPLSLLFFSSHFVSFCIILYHFVSFCFIFSRICPLLLSLVVLISLLVPFCPSLLSPTGSFRVVAIKTFYSLHIADNNFSTMTVLESSSTLVMPIPIVLFDFLPIYCYNTNFTEQH